MTTTARPKDKPQISNQLISEVRVAAFLNLGIDDVIASLRAKYPKMVISRAIVKELLWAEYGE